MDLNSGRVITRRKVTEIPVTKVVIDAVEHMAEKEGFNSLKFKNRNCIVFFDTDWVAGVDYDENEHENDENDEDEDFDEDFDAEEEEDDHEDDHEDYEEEIDQEEIDELIADAESENPNLIAPQESQAEGQVEE